MLNRGETEGFLITRTAKAGLLALLLLLNMVSALAVIYSTHWNRQLFGELQKLDEKAVYIEAEWGRLLLENSSLGAYSRIESIAHEKLGMREPAVNQTILVNQ
ncbi:cell division protein FtsL [Sinobacterium caligoides]|uniref:Cell division protein FtsL n=1 Tax=Sinobacterium caligoides TaxID=933926 RepID=A0A3N2D562_9GAMM|nr:cell division protein FtsL [Sinobacterium caligoides]ROR94788.1 cell division protein FtsL [Sinobacterium caligoides]